MSSGFMLWETTVGSFWICFFFNQRGISSVFFFFARICLKLEVKDVLVPEESILEGKLPTWPCHFFPSWQQQVVGLPFLF